MMQNSENIIVRLIQYLQQVVLDFDVVVSPRHCEPGSCFEGTTCPVVQFADESLQAGGHIHLISDMFSIFWPTTLPDRDSPLCPASPGLTDAPHSRTRSP